MIQRPIGAAARRSLDALVRGIAEASVEAVCRLVAQRVESMSLCEARGYIRGRANREIRRQTRLALAPPLSATPARELMIVLRATERVTPLVLRQLKAARAHSAEVRAMAPYAGRRAA